MTTTHTPAPITVGSIVTGRCVTIGDTVRGRVVDVITPAPFSGGYGPVYRVTDATDAADRPTHDRILEAVTVAPVRRGTVTVDIPTVIATATDPVSTDDGGAVFGMALGELGFGDIVTMRSGAMIATHPTGVRVTVRPDDVDHVTIMGPVDRRGWVATFTGPTPVGIVVATVAAAVVAR